MTMFRLFALTALLLISAQAGAGAAGPHAPAADTTLVHQAKYVCGKFETGWGCRYESGEVESGGKSSIPNVGVKRPDEQPPLAPPPAPGQVEVPAQATACKGGSPGADPGTCQCPANSEQLGGACVRYTARCNKGLAAIGPVDACAGAAEKLACKIRSDGLRDCCCLTYER